VKGNTSTTILSYNLRKISSFPAPKLWYTLQCLPINTIK